MCFRMCGLMGCNVQELYKVLPAGDGMLRQIAPENRQLLLRRDDAALGIVPHAHLFQLPALRQTVQAAPRRVGGNIQQAHDVLPHQRTLPLRLRRQKFAGFLRRRPCA